MFVSKKSICFINIVAIIYFLILEINIGLQESSKGIIASKILNGNLDEEFLILGSILKYLYISLFSIFDYFNFLTTTTRSEHVIVSMIFFITPMMWLILFNIVIIKNKTFLNLVVFILLFCNPVFIEFIHYSWRQALALAFFLIFWSLNFNYLKATIFSIFSIFIHFGILPTFSIMLMLQALNKKKYLVILILLLIFSSFVITQLLPFTENLVPKYFPYYERLTLSFDTESLKDTPINNKEGNYILKYFVAGLVPVLIVLFKLISKKLYFFEYKANYDLILAGSFPLVLLAAVPTANRLSYFLVFISLIYGPEILNKLIKMFWSKKNCGVITYFFLFLGHCIIFTYYIIFK